MFELKIIKGEASEIEKQAARQIKDIVGAKPDAVIALAVGRDMKGLYKRLGEMCAAGELSLKNVRILAVTEFSGRHDCENFLKEQLLCAADVSEENCFFPDAEAPEEYDRLIESLGGLDLAVLGIGQDAHIGYNEPATPFDSHTHVQKLTDRTKRQLSERGYTEANMPGYAVTMGVKTLTEARNIILLAEGEDKAAAVFEMVYGKTITYIPASFLQIPTEVAVYLDTAAASRL